MHSKSHNIEFMINDGADKIIKEISDSLKIEIKVIQNQ